MADSAPTAEDLLAHAEWLNRLARALVGDSAADDVAQDTFEAALSSSSRREGPMRPWLRGIARNVARMSARGRARRERREQAVPVNDEVPSPEQLLARARIQQTVNRLVLELPEPLRSTLLLRFFEGMSAADIARAQGIPAATVRSRLKDALDRIRAGLDAEHGNDRRAWAGILVPVAASHGGAASGGVFASMLFKAVLAIAIAALIIAGTRVAGLWGSEPAPPAPIAKTTPPADARVATAGHAAAARDLPAVHEDDPMGALRLEGQVIDEEGAPVAKAMVAIDAHPPIVVETESDGAFVFERLIRRDYRIEATGGDRYADARLRMTDNPEPLTLRMHAGGSVEVSVTDREGAVIEGAEVELRSALTWKATTDARGVAKLAGLGAGWSPLVVRARGYAPAAMMQRTSGDPDIVEHASFSLARGAELAGRVVDERGAPIANARVVATSTSEVLTVVDPPRDAVATAADGSFSIPILSAGTWRVTASAGDYAPTTTAPISMDGIHARSRVELQLSPGAVVRGTVKDATGALVPGAEVSLVVQGYVPWRSRRQVFTDADGRFAIRGLAPRAVDVVARDDRGASAIVPVDLETEREHEVTLTLDVSGTITGTIVDNRGQPLADAQVIATPDGDRAAWVVRGAPETVSDQTGAFRLAGLPDGSYTVRGARPGAPDAMLWLSDGVSTTPRAAPIRLVIPDDGRVSGRVQLADGTPVTAFTIALGGTTARPILTKDGTFALPAAAGAYTLTVAGADFVTTNQEVTIGGDTDVGTITVVAGRSISGRVLDEQGVPVPGGTVAAGALLSGGGADLYIKTESIAAKDTVTDAQGRFVLAGLPPATLTVIAGKATSRSASVQLPAGDDSVTLDLVLGATSGIEGTVTRDGKPLGDTMITANPIGAMWSSFFVTTGPDGAFALDALAPGAYVVYPMLGRGGNGPGSMYMRRVEVVPGKRARVEIDATPGPVKLAVSIKTEQGDALPMGRVGAIQLSIDPQTAEELRDGSQMPTDRMVAMYGGAVRDGAGVIEGMRPGTYTLCAMIGDPRVASSVKLRCHPWTVTTATGQTASIVVPAAWREH